MLLDKKEDTFFDEKTADDTASEDLLKMIDAKKEVVTDNVPVGSKVTGRVIRIGTEYVFVDIRSKNEAMISRAEVLEKDGSLLVKEGDELTAYVVSNVSGETVLSKSMAGKGRTAAVQEILDALNNRVPVQGKVTGINKGGLNVKVLGNRAFCPSSQIDVKFTEDINSYLGKTLDFVITRVTEGGRNIVVSRIPLLEGDLEKKLDALARAAEAHLVLNGSVTRITDFGLFVDIGDFEGLVHISEVSWERAQNLGEDFAPGQKVECVVLGVEKRSPLRNSKISLSIKQTSDNPWKTVSARFSPGQSVAGKVTRLMPFGAFVEIAPGIEGLVHVSEMSWIKRVHHPSDVVSEGQQVQVVVLSIDETKKTVSLSLKDTAADPWRDAQARFAPGAEVPGTVVRRAKFGFFIDLIEGVTALLPLGNIAADKKDSVKEGAVVTTRVESVDPAARRISLSLGLKEVQEQTAEVKAWLSSQGDAVKPAAGAVSGGSTEFGAALLEAMKKKSK